MAFAAWNLDRGSSAGQLERDRGLPSVRLGGTDADRGNQTEVACDGAGEDGNPGTSASLEQRC